MLGWLQLATLLLKFANGIVDSLHERRLIDAGTAESVVAGIKQSQKGIARVMDARRRFRTDADYRERVRRTYTADD